MTIICENSLQIYFCDPQAWTFDILVFRNLYDILVLGVVIIWNAEEQYTMHKLCATLAEVLWIFPTHSICADKNTQGGAIGESLIVWQSGKYSVRFVILHTTDVPVFWKFKQYNCNHSAKLWFFYIYNRMLSCLNKQGGMICETQWPSMLNKLPHCTW